jgi:hypothetical protein
LRIRAGYVKNRVERSVMKENLEAYGYLP